MLITVEDSENRARIKLQRAVDEVKKLLVPMVSCYPGLICYSVDGLYLPHFLTAYHSRIFGCISLQ